MLDDLREAPPEHLRQRALTILGLCGLSTLQYLPPAARDPAAFAAWVESWRDVLQQASRYADATSNEELFAAVVDYVLDTCELPRPVVHRLLDHRLTDDTMKKKFVSTLAQTRLEGRLAGIAEGKAEGIAEGKAEGKVEGKFVGIADTLLRLITRRFGTPDGTVVARVRSASPTELDRWTERILDADTIAELFAE